MVRLIRGRYEPQGPSIRGGEGAVMRALDHMHGRPVAIKVRGVTDAPSRQRALSEAKVLLDLVPHAALPRVREDFVLRGRYHLVMDWIDGVDVRALIASEGPLPVERVVSYLRPVAEALDHLHAHDPPVVHGDVKPSNIVVTPAGRVVLVDFGLAAATGATASSGHTAGYAAPEVAAGHAPTTAGDVFGLAATAFAMLTGRPPGPGAPLDLDARIRDVLAAGLATDPSRRPPSATAFLAMLDPTPPPNNLPQLLVTLVGRHADRDRLDGALRAARLVTLTGPGGVGKTVLALDAAHRLLGTFPDGAWFADLGRLDPGSDVGAAVAAAAGIADPSRADTLTRVVERVRSSRTLLLLDNCEHVLGSCARVVRVLLESCPSLVVLATSRERLAVPGEVLVAVEPLAAASAAELFVERAGRGVHDPGLVEQVVDGLDGIPLAIEMAAAATRVMPLAALASARANLDMPADRAVARHETMRETIDWSYRSLSPSERATLDRLSVFAAGFTPEAASVVAGSPNADLDLARLADRSMIAVEPDAGRYRLLGPIREFAAERLRAPEVALDALLQWADDIVARHRDDPRELDADADNLRAALRWGETSPDRADRALRVAANLRRYWEHRALWSEARERLGRLCALAPGHSVALARATAALGWFTLRVGDVEGAARTLDQACEISRVLDDTAGQAEALGMRASADLVQGKLAAALPRLEQSLDLARRAGGASGVAAALTNLATVSGATGEHARAVKLLEEAIALYRGVGDDSGAATVLANLGAMHRFLGRIREAREPLEQALEITRRTGDRDRLPTLLLNLAELRRADRDVDAARGLFDDCLDAARRTGEIRIVGTALESLAAMETERGDHHAACALLRESAGIAQTLGDERSVAERTCRFADAIAASSDPRAARRPYTEAALAAERCADAATLASSLRGLAGVAAAERRWTRVARLLGRADAGGGPASAAPALHEAAIAALGHDAFKKIYAAGGSTPVGRLVRRAVSAERPR